MLNIKKTWEGIIIEDKVVFCNDFCAEDNTKYIILRKTINTDFLDNNAKEINFPWEYDIKGTSVVSVEAKNGTLGYIVKMWDIKFAIIQHKSMLEFDDIEESKYLIFFDESISEKIDQMELDGQKINISDFNSQEWE